MRIHQITDLHVPERDDDARFSYVRPNVTRQFSFVAADESDLLVISGDLTMEDASRGGCKWIESHLPDVPTLIIPGNHDDPALLWDVFAAERCVNPQFCFAIEEPECSLVFLNTSSAYLPGTQIEFLASLAVKEPALLFIHHPPHLLGAGYMSINWPLMNHREAAAAIRGANIRHVFCGHYHNAADVECDGFSLHLSPSPAFQIDLNSEEFLMQEFEPAVRRITVDAGSVRTELVEV